MTPREWAEKVLREADTMHGPDRLDIERTIEAAIAEARAMSTDIPTDAEWAKDRHARVQELQGKLADAERERDAAQNQCATPERELNQAWNALQRIYDFAEPDGLASWAEAWEHLAALKKLAADALASTASPATATKHDEAMQIVRRLAHVEIMDTMDRCVFCLEMNGAHDRYCLHAMAVSLCASDHLDTHKEKP